MQNVVESRVGIDEVVAMRSIVGCNKNGVDLA